jgi:hypothetical protein
MTVTGVTVPSGANNCVMPTFLPMIPLIIPKPQVQSSRFKVQSGKALNFEP